MLLYTRKEIHNGRGPAQDFPYDLIIWYVYKIIHLL